MSQTLPAHLANVPRPNADEVHLASQITANLTEMAKQLPPNAITAPHAIRKALGVSNGKIKLNAIYDHYFSVYVFFSIIEFGIGM